MFDFVQRNRKALAVAGVVLLSSASVYNNYNNALLLQASQTPAALEQYSRFPAWMHTDPVQVLGLHAAVSPNFIPNENDINRAVKRSRATWAPDKWRRNSFHNESEANLAHMRIVDAENTLKLWYENPFCRDSLARLRHSQGPNFTYADGLPSFDNPCRCTYPSYVAEQLKKAVIPVSMQARDLGKERDLGSYCPCTKAEAASSWATFAKDKQPPHIKRIFASLPWKTMDWRVLQYKLKYKFFSTDVTLDDSFKAYPPDKDKIEACVEGKTPGCEDLPGWVVEEDFLNILSRACDIPGMKIWRAKQKAAQYEEQWHAREDAEQAEREAAGAAE